jgi:hypothetical protein
LIEPFFVIFLSILLCCVNVISSFSYRYFLFCIYYIYYFFAI